MAGTTTARKKALKKRGGAKKEARSAHNREVAGSSPAPATIFNDLQEFQQAYGPDWLRIVQSAPFKAGLLLLNIRKLDSITTLTNGDIEKNGREILADLRGHMKHENDLMSLHTMQDFVLHGEEPEEYFSPEQVAEMEMVKERFRQQNEKSRYA